MSSEALDKTEFKQPSMNPYDYLPMREVQNYQNFGGVQNYVNIDYPSQNYQNINYMHMRKLPDNHRVPEYGQLRKPVYQNMRRTEYQNARVPDYQNVDYMALRSSKNRGDESDFSDDDCKENEFSVDEGIYSLPSNLITSTPLPLLCNGYQVNMVKN